MEAELSEIKRYIMQQTEQNNSINHANKQHTTETTNRFECLDQGEPEISEIDSMDDDDEEFNPFILIKKKLRNKNSSTTTKTTSTVTQPKKVTATKKTGQSNITFNTNITSLRNIRPPPIHIHTQPINDTISLMKGLKIEQFHIKRVNKTKHTLQIESMDNYKAAKEVLNEVNTPYFTYTPKNEKHKSIVLKGLHEDEDVNELKAIIKAHDINVTNVTQLKTKNSTTNEYKLPLYIVQCSPDTNMGQIYNIRTINYQTVTWENLKKNDAIMQCHQCQRFGHAAANCNLRYRCVKCAHDHAPGQCTIKEQANIQDIYCANCKTNGHPASYKGCPIYQATLTRLKERISEKRNKIPANIPIHENTYVNTEKGTFAEMLRGGKKTTNNKEPTTNNNIEIDNRIQDLNNKLEKMAETILQQGEQIATLLALIQQLVE